MVLDTAAIVAAVRSDAGASRRPLVAGLERRLTLLASVPLMLEYDAVSRRPEHFEAAGLSSSDIEVLLDGIASVAEPVRLAFLWRPTLRDADDDMVLKAAVNGRADMIVTFNLHDFGTEAKRFGMAVQTPGQTLKQIGTDA